MAVDVTAEVDVERPRTMVAEFAMDPANDTRWIGGVKSARLLTEPPFGQGSRTERVAGFLGKRIEYIMEAAEYRRGERLALRAIKGPFPMHVTYDFADAGSGTLVRIQIQGDATGFFRLAAPMLSRAVKRSLDGDLRRLKEHLEGSP